LIALSADHPEVACGHGSLTALAVLALDLFHAVSLEDREAVEEATVMDLAK